jgi:hypothetical protein
MTHRLRDVLIKNLASPYGKPKVWKAGRIERLGTPFTSTSDMRAETATWSRRTPRMG